MTMATFRDFEDYQFLHHHHINPLPSYNHHHQSVDFVPDFIDLDSYFNDPRSEEVMVYEELTKQRPRSVLPSNLVSNALAFAGTAFEDVFKYIGFIIFNIIIFNLQMKGNVTSAVTSLQR
jgi:hypothetical protein